MARPALSRVGEIVRRHDPDRYFTSLFAPAVHRETLWTLYAFNHELARAREAVREPFAALIRLQWWREVVEGARSRRDVGGHEVAGPVGDALDAGLLLRADLAGMIEAREAEAEGMETLAAFEAYVQGSAGGVMVAAGRALGMDEAGALRDWGAAYGVAGVLRNVAALARQGRCFLPGDLLAEAGLSEGTVLADPDAPGMATVRARLADVARSWLRSAPRVPRGALSAALPVVLARRDLGRRATGSERRLGDRVVVAWAAARGRV